MEEKKEYIADDTKIGYNYEANNHQGYNDNYGSKAAFGVKESSNIITGFVGAVVGSFIGVALWMIIFYFGFISAIAGIVIIFCGLKGYELLGGALDKKGVIVVAVISIIMVFVANHLSVTLDYYLFYKDYYRVTYMEVLQSMPELLKENEDMTYITNLVLGYVFTVLGGASMLYKLFKSV